VITALCKALPLLLVPWLVPRGSPTDEEAFGFAIYRKSLTSTDQRRDQDARGEHELTPSSSRVYVRGEHDKEDDSLPEFLATPDSSVEVGASFAASLSPIGPQQARVAQARHQPIQLELRELNTSRELREKEWV
jgi:hypothetical protein